MLGDRGALFYTAANQSTLTSTETRRAFSLGSARFSKQASPSSPAAVEHGLYAICLLRTWLPMSMHGPLGLWEGAPDGRV